MYLYSSEEKRFLLYCSVRKPFSYTASFRRSTFLKLSHALLIGIICWQNTELEEEFFPSNRLFPLLSRCSLPLDLQNQKNDCPSQLRRDKYSAHSAGAAVITNTEVNRDFAGTFLNSYYCLMQKAGIQMMMAHLWCDD